MKKTVLIVIVALLLAMPVFSQQGEYVRKSVSSLDSIWYQPGSLGISLDLDSFQRFMELYIEVDRFDYNELPSEYVREFRNQANRLYDVNAETLADVLEETVVAKILEILNDPEVQQARGEELKSAATARSFAATKARSVGLTADELEVLFNSAYIYLPFITKAERSTLDDGRVRVEIEGGIVWWKIDVRPDGSATVREVLSTTANGRDTVHPRRAPNYFTFGNESWRVTPELYAQNNALLAFARNLGVRTKEIDDFRLTAQIIEIPRPGTYGFNIGRREGIHLDDGFHVVEYEENELGEAIPVNKGFVRVSRTGQNIDDPTSFSYGRQLIGRPVSEGAVLIEHPRLGIDMVIRTGLRTGVFIHRGKHARNYLEEDATEIMAFNLKFAYNVAPITGLTQTFLYVDNEFGIPMASMASSVAAFTWSPYFGATKRWGGRTNLSLSAGLGLDSFSLTGVDDWDRDVSLTTRSFGVQGDAEVGYMLSPDWSIYGIIGVKETLSAFYLSTEIVSASLSDYDDMDLGGVYVGAGVSYSLGALPFNLFGWLDPLKKH